MQCTWSPCVVQVHRASGRPNLVWCRCIKQAEYPASGSSTWQAFLIATHLASHPTSLVPDCLPLLDSPRSLTLVLSLATGIYPSDLGRESGREST